MAGGNDGCHRTANVSPWTSNDARREPLSAAARELEEETGYRAGRMQFLFVFGLLHGLLLYFGDITHMYAVAGMALIYVLLVVVIRRDFIVTPFVAVPANVPLDEMTPPAAALTDPVARRDALASARMNFREVDRAPEDALNRILWRAMKGTRGVSQPFLRWAMKVGHSLFRS